MRIAHLADLHLGYRQFERTEASGANCREADVERALTAAVDGILAEAPDVALIAGDVFHAVRPTNRAILRAFAEVTRLRSVVRRVIVIAGNHDTPRSVETGRILPLLEAAGADVVTMEPARFSLNGATVTAVPSNAVTRIPPPLPEGVNILLLHADVLGYNLSSRTAFGRDHLDPDALVAGWDYVALGDYHVAAEVRPRMWYAGALEYTSSNPWAEINGGPKGWLLVELGADEPRVRLMPVPTRRYIDLPPVYGGGMDGPALNQAIADRIAEFPIKDAVARLIVVDVPRAVKTALDYRQIARWKAEALNLHLELRRPESEQSTPERRAALHQSLTDQVRAFLEGRDLPPGLSKPDFVELGMKFLDDVRPEPGGPQ